MHSVPIGLFLNGANLLLNSVVSLNSRNLINQRNMNWTQFKDPVSHMCLDGTVVASNKMNKMNVFRRRRHWDLIRLDLFSGHTDFKNIQY